MLLLIFFLVCLPRHAYKSHLWHITGQKFFFRKHSLLQLVTHSTLMYQWRSRSGAKFPYKPEKTESLIS